MDVRCSTCSEAWDVDHLWYEIIFDTQLSREEVQCWRNLPRSQKLNDRYRQEFRAVGWEFGQTVINITRCPCCPKDAQPNQEIVQRKANIETLMAEYQDELAATYSDCNL
jgi:hypothetical protein